MKKIHAYAETGFCGAYWEEDFEFDDDATEEDIDATISDWAEEAIMCNMSYHYEEEKGE